MHFGCDWETSNHDLICLTVEDSTQSQWPPFLPPPKTHMGVSKNSGTPKSSILIGFSIIFTIHFGGFPPIFGNTHILKLTNWWVQGSMVFSTWNETTVESWPFQPFKFGVFGRAVRSWTGGKNEKNGTSYCPFFFLKNPTGMFMVLSKWIITPI